MLPKQEPASPNNANLELETVELIDLDYADKSILRNLLELYSYDMSEFEDMHVNAHGLYGYRYLDPYWTEEGRAPLLVRVRGQWAGFALMRTVEIDAGQFEHRMAEFFIMKCFRRCGMGRHVAHAVFDRFPGPWSLMIVPRNLPAQTFWRKTVGAYIGGDFNETVDPESQDIFIKFVASPPPRNASNA